MVSLRVIVIAALVLSSLELADASFIKRFFGREGEEAETAGLFHAGEEVKADGSDILMRVVELDYVTIMNATRPLLRNPNKYKVRCTHTFDNRAGVSMKLAPLRGNLSDVDDKAWVNKAFIATEEGLKKPLKCDVIESRLIKPDRVVLTTDVDGVYLTDEDGVVEAPLIDTRGSSNTAATSSLKLKFYPQEFVNGTMDEINGIHLRPYHDYDSFYKWFLKLFHFGTHTLSSHIDDLQSPQDPADPHLKVKHLVFPANKTITFPVDDEFHPFSWFKKKLIDFLNKRTQKTNRNNPVENRALLRNEIRTKFLQNNVLEPTEGRWKAPLSDASMTRIFFHGMGMSFVEQIVSEEYNHEKYGENNHFVANFTRLSLSELKYKQGLENLGCNVFFDKQMNITMIESYSSEESSSIYTPGDSLWEWAKLKARSAMFIAASTDHLLLYHLFYGNIPGMAMRMHLSPNHPIRRAITPHMFKTHYTTASSEFTLATDSTAIGRVMPFSIESYISLVVHDRAFRNYTEELEDRGLTGSKGHIGAYDGVDLRNILLNYVSELFDEFYPTDELFWEDQEAKKMYEYMVEHMKGIPNEFSLNNLKFVFGEILFRVTGMHQVIGNAAAYAHDPFMINFRMDPKDIGKVNGNYETIYVVAVVSGKTQPDEYVKLADDWSGKLPNRTSMAYVKLRSELTALGEVIDERNANRQFQNRDFHPDVCAISILS